MTYRFSERADADIVKLYLDSLAQFGLHQAERYNAGLLHCLETLAAQPQLARERLEFNPPVRVHFYEVHVIVFLIGRRRYTDRPRPSWKAGLGAIA